MPATSTLDALLQELRARLQAAGIETPGLEARMLLGAATGLDTAQLIAHGTDPATAEQAARADTLSQRRCAGEPMAHILGRRAFWTLDLGVSPACLIPRPETELLVGQALAILATCDTEAPRVLDLGTGPGTIILALLSERPGLQAFASDHSHEALLQAKANAHELGLSVHLWQGDWLGAVTRQRGFDLIACNPPYIDPDDPHLTRGDLRFEPRTALAAEEQGLADLHRVIDSAREHLNPGGWLLLEHGFDQGEPVRQRLRTTGYQAVRTLRDTAGHERTSLGKI
ncbi:peptide chain release factor N(5)-glutamine methyltransferase [Thioalkalivibrio sp. ALJ7]|uniref:peptide chain release factor N(5)-glutamine methyltransferase n=1 Tax=Thioalkalivibrio sp. ALJ7 TaxID=1158756 RepID=UPI000381CE80|nr:peptide chain release factor N(5)-glutamine methyltransferase [Thioalkalivibrio sp. ALJ7]